MGEVVDDGGVLVIRRIVVSYRLIGVPPEHWPTVERVHAVHARGCPVARSLAGGIEIETRLELVDA